MKKLVVDAPGSKTKTYPVRKKRKKLTTKRASAMTPGPCYFDGSQDDVMVGRCSGPPGPEDYCFGCKQWICKGHNKTKPCGRRDPYEHIEEEGRSES